MKLTKLVLLLLLIANGLTFAQHHVRKISATRARKPLAVPSNEATKDQLRLAREQGDAAERSVTWALQRASPTGGETSAGEYSVAYTITAPEGWYELEGKELAWREPADVNAHLRVFVRDGTDGRPVPGLTVGATLFNGAGQAVEAKKLPLSWNPLLDAYAENLRLPPNGTYRLQVDIAPPGYRRHDPYNGDRFTEQTHAVFDAVVINSAALANQMPASDTAPDEQLALARAEGEAYTRTLKAMHEQTSDGGETQVGDYLVGYAVEFAEGFWHYHNGKFRYHKRPEQSAEVNSHVEVAVRDAHTRRFMPGLRVKATLYQRSGNPIGTLEEPFMWHPWLFHYGENWRVPGSGVYKLRVRFEPPAYRRYGREAGKRFVTAVEIDFDNVKFRTGAI